MLRHDGSLWTAGSAAYGRPGERNPTRLALLMRKVLEKRDQKKVLVMCSTIDMLTPHEVRFSDLERQTILYGPFNEPVLGHLLDALLGKLLAHHSFLHMLVRFLRSVADHCLGISKYAFRRLLVDAIEHAGVWLLKEQHDDLDLIRERQANLSRTAMRARARLGAPPARPPGRPSRAVTQFHRAPWSRRITLRLARRWARTSS